MTSKLFIPLVTSVGALSGGATIFLIPEAPAKNPNYITFYKKNNNGTLILGGKETQVSNQNQNNQPSTIRFSGQAWERENKEKNGNVNSLHLLGEKMPEPEVKEVFQVSIDHKNDPEVAVTENNSQSRVHREVKVESQESEQGWETILQKTKRGEEAIRKGYGEKEFVGDESGEHNGSAEIYIKGATCEDLNKKFENSEVKNRNMFEFNVSSIRFFEGDKMALWSCHQRFQKNK